ncbi:putative protein OS=Afipia felis OX=1035 GN=BN961_02915 PE=4 SV=1 [Afipia felis]
MSLPEPFDLLADFPGWVTVFEPMWRQEQSREAGGRTYVKDLGDPLWMLSAQSRQLDPNEIDYWRARLNAMENGLATFRGYSMSRCFPIRYPRGSWPTGLSFDGVAALASIGANRKSVSLSGLPSGYVISVGDYIQIGDADLHQVVESSIASGAGVSSMFEVRPHLWPGVNADVDPAVEVLVRRPSCLMAIVPGSIQSQADPQTGWGSVSFQAIEAR